MDSAVATPTRLRVALDAAGLSVRELALATGLQERSLYRYLAGEREPRAGEALAIARALGVEPPL